MSRNLRGGANKGFNFAMGGGESSSSDQEEETKVFVAPVHTRIKGKPMLLGLQVDDASPVSNR